MSPQEIKDLCANLRKRGAEEAKKSRRDPAEQDLIEFGLLALEAHLVNQARIADTLGKLLVHVRSNP